ncbi:MAG: chemotaxis protein CheA [Deltaproteobacteria bacterium]|nr:chemotaxis protein CheA [Deltaproteobacteria bacterium]
MSQENDNSLKEFLAESEEIIEELSNDLMKLGSSAEAGEKADPGVLNSIFRSAHSLKGLSGMFGFEPMLNLTHNLEELLDALRLGKITFGPAIVDTLFEAISIVQSMLESKSAGKPVEVDIDPIVSKLSETINANQKGEELSAENSGIDQGILDVLTEYEEHRLNESISEGLNIFKVQASFPIATFDQGLEEISELLKQMGEIITTLPTPGATPGETINFDIVVATKTTQEKLDETIDNDKVVVTLASGGKEAAAEEKVETAAAAAPTAASLDEGLKSISRTVRVDIAKLDELMHMVGELVLTKGSIHAMAEVMKYKAETANYGIDLQKTNKTFEKILAQLQEGLMEARMVPLGQVFDKLSRTIRKLGRDIGKEVTLDIRGAETKLDKLIVEELASPLMHIVRNSMDHGLEFPEEREASGKPRKGTITFDAFQSGNHVIIEVSDDGKGIDRDKILDKAIEKGLVSKGERVKEEDILEFMFMPGFSTSDEVSELSGRGVGMDVVKQNIAEISGMVEIDSTKGKGTKIILTLPMTLAIIKALMVEVSGKNFAIPLNPVLENFLLEDTHIETIETKEFVHLRNSTVPLIRLNSFLGLSTENSASKYVVVVGLADKKLGLVVDELMGQQDVVIKTTGKRLGDGNVIAGATEYRQETILALDVGAIIEECSGEHVNVKVES